MSRTIWSGTLLLTACLLAGCSQPVAPEAAQSSLVETGGRFNPAECGSLTGQVLWSGTIPEVPSYRAPFVPRPESGIMLGRFSWANRRAPVIADQQGLASAVVFLKEVDPQRSRPWDLPPVTVEIEKHQLAVHQGDGVSPYGFVQRGRTFDMVTRDTFFHSIQARGATFFCLPFPDPDLPRTRRIDRQGVIELSSGCGEFWMAGFLFVDDHPYYARTDRQGRFTLPQIPAGTYRLVCWHPDWHEASRELDGDTWEVAAIEYLPPLTVEKTVKVEPGKTGTVEIAFPSPIKANPNAALGH